MTISIGTARYWVGTEADLLILCWRLRRAA
jgi:hypothetical protein